jgi:hypothetical protein
MMNMINQIHPGIMDLSYSVVQAFFEEASLGLGPVVPAPAAGQILNVEVTQRLSTLLQVPRDHTLRSRGEVTKDMETGLQHPTREEAFMGYPY